MNLDPYTAALVALAVGLLVQSARLRHARVEWARAEQRRHKADQLTATVCQERDAALATARNLGDDAAYWEAEANHQAAVALALTDPARRS